MAKQVMTVDQMRKLVPGTATKDMLRSIHEHIPHYILKQITGKRRLGYCTHCKQEFEMPSSVRQGAKIDCPACGHKCYVKDAGRSRQSMKDRLFFVYFKRAYRRNDAIAMLGIEIYVNWARVDFKAVQPQCFFSQMMLYEYGKGTTRYDQLWNWREGGRYEWVHVKAIGVHRVANQIPSAVDYDSLAVAVEGTPFKRMKCIHYRELALINYLDMASRWQSVEYLEKLGFDRLVDERADNRNTYSAVNWNGKNVTSVLRLKKKSVNELRKNQINPGCDELRIMQRVEHSGEALSVLQVAELFNAFGFYDLSAMLDMSGLAKLSKIAAYLQKQRQIYEYKHLCFRDWKDYIGFCTDLGMCMTDEAVLFPSRLKEAHDRRMDEHEQRFHPDRWQAKQDRIEAEKREAEEQDEKIAKVFIRHAKHFSFKMDDLIMRPARSAQELLAESNALHHCVRTYAKRYADGATVICFIRKADTPDVPFFTVEFRPKDRDLMQCRGKHNCSVTPEIQAFLDAFAASHTKKERISA